MGMLFSEQIKDKVKELAMDGEKYRRLHREGGS